MKSFKFNNVYLNNFYTMLGKTENNPVVKNKVDYVYDDYYVNNKSLEESESWFQNIVVDGLLKKSNKQTKNINLLIGADLNNQLFSSIFNASYYNMSFFGIYSACASFIQGLIIGASLIHGNLIDNSIIVSSSHNLVNEKQFRFPIEYGAVKKKQNSFSCTGAVSTLISNEKSKIKIEGATIGKVIDLNHKDPNDMGSAMAPAAAEVIYDHLKTFKRNINYYDLILTGDLGVYGLSILKEYLYRTYELKIKKIEDAGSLLYDTTKNSDFAGGSGPICLPLILFNKILDMKKFKKILLVGTGSLHSQLSVNLNKGMPAVAHAISLEVKR